METEGMLERYHEDASADLRNEILVRNLALVHHVVRKVIGSDGWHADYEDLVSSGILGLIEAIERFDPSRGYVFSTYAAPRIRGAILDGLRRRDHASRSMRKKARSISRARERLTGRLEREPRDQEVAGELDLDLETFWRWEGKVAQADRVSLEKPVGSDEPGNATRLDFLVGEDGSEIEDLVTRSQEAALLRDAIGELPDQERTVLALYYYEELKLMEIGEVLSLSESRISQIRTKALGTLRHRLAHLAPEMAAA